MRISDWSSDVCSSDLLARSSRTPGRLSGCRRITAAARRILDEPLVFVRLDPNFAPVRHGIEDVDHEVQDSRVELRRVDPALGKIRRAVEEAITGPEGSEEHKSEQQSIMRNTHAVISLKTKKPADHTPETHT